MTTRDHLTAMKAVGVKQLKARLSEYLRLVQRGEVLLLTHRDEVIAEIRPARRAAGMPDDTEALLDVLAESGDVTRAHAHLMLLGLVLISGFIALLSAPIYRFMLAPLAATGGEPPMMTTFCPK